VSPGADQARQPSAAGEQLVASASAAADHQGSVEQGPVEQGTGEQGTEDGDSHRPWPSLTGQRETSR
jgi:hypothetical protein